MTTTTTLTNEKRVTYDYHTGVTTIARTLHRRWRVIAEGDSVTTTITCQGHVLAELPTDVSPDRTFSRFIKALGIDGVRELLEFIPTPLTRADHAVADAMVRAIRIMGR